MRGPAINQYKSVPTVARMHRGMSLLRPGRGFSIAELFQAGVTKDQAKRLKLPVDPRRRTVYGSNVEFVKAITLELKTRESKPSSGGVD